MGSHSQTFLPRQKDQQGYWWAAHSCQQSICPRSYERRLRSRFRRWQVRISLKLLVFGIQILTFKKSLSRSVTEVRVDSLQRQAYIWNLSYKSCFCWSRMQKCFCLGICEWLFPVVFVNMWNCIYICFWLKIVCLFASHSLLVRQFPALDVESCCCSRKNWLKIPRLAGCWWLSVLHLSHPGYHLFGLTFLDNFASNETKGQPHSAKSKLQNLSGMELLKI